MASFTLTQSPQDARVLLVVGPDGIPVSSIDEFLLHLFHCGRSAYTLRSYARGLAHFFGWLHTTGKSVDNVTPQTVEAYIAFFSTEPKEEPVQLIHTRSVRSICAQGSLLLQSTGNPEPSIIN